MTWKSSSTASGCTVGGSFSRYLPVAGARGDAVGCWGEMRQPLAASALPANLGTEKRHSHRTTTVFAHLSQSVRVGGEGGGGDGEIKDIWRRYNVALSKRAD